MAEIIVHNFKLWNMHRRGGIMRVNSPRTSVIQTHPFVPFFHCLSPLFRLPFHSVPHCPLLSCTLSLMTDNLASGTSYSPMLVPILKVYKGAPVGPFPFSSFSSPSILSSPPLRFFHPLSCTFFFLPLSSLLLGSIHLSFPFSIGREPTFRVPMGEPHNEGRRIHCC